MARTFFFVLGSLLLGIFALIPDQDCPVGFCDRVSDCALFEGDCPNNNLTFSVENGGICGCCRACVRFIGPNEACSIEGQRSRLGMDGVVDSGQCLPGYECKDDICAEPNSQQVPCLVKAWNALLKANANPNIRTWLHIPKCEVRRKEETGEETTMFEGFYSHIQCQGGKSGRCYCANPIDGTKLFGYEFQLDVEEKKDMNCACTLEWFERRQRLEHVTLRSELNGNYKSLQCDKDICFCVNGTTTEFIGPFLPKSLWTMLPCYDPEEFPDEMYYPFNSCGHHYNLYRIYADELEAHGTIVSYVNYPDCDPDGTYAPAQVDVDR
ncbi:unnamed protein product [Darwinula stevensoni]|uniref:Thyroglobulin type-1 domain-containing protein n=1 Tax=Darwinula stevensoni TaxID=69355 RepID=A0A7R9A7W9_9CRUS|nr:unnamed protein product [Darwinula stevensoni]CAG0895421.1 unnamed protein product [Darwinula stevensoni]